MEKGVLINKISQEISLLEKEEIRQVFDFIRFLRHREEIDPTLEILQSDKDYQKVQEGLCDKAEGKVKDWDSVK